MLCKHNDKIGYKYYDGVLYWIVKIDFKQKTVYIKAFCDDSYKQAYRHSAHESGFNYFKNYYYTKTYANNSVVGFVIKILIKRGEIK